MDGTGTPSLRSCRTYRVIARAMWVSTAEVVSSGVVTTVLLWSRTATTPGAIGRLLCRDLPGDRRGAADGRGLPRRSAARAPAPSLPRAIGSSRSGSLRRFTQARPDLRCPGLERYRQYADRSPSCQGVVLERYRFVPAPNDGSA